MYIKRYFNFINESNSIDKVYNNINWSLEKEDVESFFYNLKDLSDDVLKINVSKGFVYKEYDDVQFSDHIYFTEDIIPEGKLYWLIKIEVDNSSNVNKSDIVDLTEYFELAIKGLEEFMGNKSKIEDTRGNRIKFNDIKVYNNHIENRNLLQYKISIYLEDPNKYEFSYKDYLDYNKITYNENNIENSKLFAEIDINKLAELTISKSDKFKYDILVDGFSEELYSWTNEYVSSYYFLDDDLSNDNIEKLIKNFINHLGYTNVLEYIDDDIENEDELIDFLLLNKEEFYSMMSDENYILLDEIKDIIEEEYLEYLTIYVYNEVLKCFNEELKDHINFEFKENTRTYKVYFDNTIYGYILDGVININNYKNSEIEDVISDIIYDIKISFRGLSLDPYLGILNNKRLNDKIKSIL